MGALVYLHGIRAVTTRPDSVALTSSTHSGAT